MKTYVLVLIRGAFDEYPLLYENICYGTHLRCFWWIPITLWKYMLWYSSEVLLMNTHYSMKTYVMILIRGAFDEYPLLYENICYDTHQRCFWWIPITLWKHMLWYSSEVLLMNTHYYENMLWYSLEVLSMNTHFPQHICFHGVKTNKYQYFLVEKGILAGAMHRVRNMVINRSVAIAAQFDGKIHLSN